jgi:hypothetical protein
VRGHHVGLDLHGFFQIKSALWAFVPTYQSLQQISYRILLYIAKIDVTWQVESEIGGLAAILRPVISTTVEVGLGEGLQGRIPALCP